MIRGARETHVAQLAKHGSRMVCGVDTLWENALLHKRIPVHGKEFSEVLTGLKEVLSGRY